MSLRALAQEVGVQQSYLSRVSAPAGRSQSRRASATTARKIAVALGLPEDYFPEVHEDFVVTQIRKDARLRDRLYRELRKAPD